MKSCLKVRTAKFWCRLDRTRRDGAKKLFHSILPLSRSPPVCVSVCVCVCVCMSECWPSNLMQSFTASKIKTFYYAPDETSSGGAINARFHVRPAGKPGSWACRNYNCVSLTIPRSSCCGALRTCRLQNCDKQIGWWWISWSIADNKHNVSSLTSWLQCAYPEWGCDRLGRKVLIEVFLAREHN